MFKKKRVGIIGLGIIGSQVAGHLRRAGYTVPVWNRTPKAQPGFLGTPAEVAGAAEVLQLFVADPEAVFSVLDAIGDALTPQHLVLCSPTLGREATLEAARRVVSRGARFLDAPFTGSKEAAARAQLLYFVGGDEAVIEEAMPILKVSGGKGVVPVGRVGDAAIVKVATNVLSAATVEVLAEMLAVVKAAGVEPAMLQKALEGHGIRSGLLDMKLPKLIGEDYETHFALRHMLKDVRFGQDLAREAGLSLPVTDAAARALAEGTEMGWGDLDFAALMKRYEAP